MMMLKGAFVWKILLAGALCFSCSGRYDRPALGDREFIFIRSHFTGSYYAAGAALARLVTNHTNFIGVNNTIHTLENERIRMLSGGEAQIVFLRGPEANMAYNGDPVYWDQQQPLRAVFALWPAVLCLVAHQESGIYKIEDIKGKSIAIYSEGSVTGDLMEYLLSLYGINRDNTTIYRVRDVIGINMLNLGITDSIWYDIGYGEHRLSSHILSGIEQFYKTGNYRLVPVEPDHRLREFLKLYPYFYLGEFGSPIGLEDAPQLMTSSFAACSAGLPDDVVYEISKLWWENSGFVRQFASGAIELINTEDNRQGVPVPFHPGAVRYLREAGLIPAPPAM